MSNLDAGKGDGRPTTVGEQILTDKEREKEAQAVITGLETELALRQQYALIDQIHVCLAKQYIKILRCSVLTCHLTPMHPKDIIESAHNLKGRLMDNYHTFDAESVVADWVIDYIQKELNPFLVEWHAFYFYHEEEVIMPKCIVLHPSMKTRTKRQQCFVETSLPAIRLATKELVIKLEEYISGHENKNSALHGAAQRSE